LNSEVLIINITFKTNRFQIKLFNIVGVTFLNTTFYLAFIFLTHKATFDFAWVFTRLKWVYDQLELLHPRTLVTDQEPGLLPALKEVLPEASQFLCTWHIDNDVEVYVRKTFTEYYDRDRETPNNKIAHVVKTILAAFMAHWKTLIYVLSEQAFDEAWENLENIYIERFPKVITYCGGMRVVWLQEPRLQCGESKAGQQAHNNRQDNRQDNRRATTKQTTQICQI
jgi:hypothetical protein